MNKKTKKVTRHYVKKISPKWHIKLMPVSSTMFFRAFILFSTLVVATIAILKNAYEPNVWTFLGSMIIYAALTRSQNVG